LLQIVKRKKLNIERNAKDEEIAKNTLLSEQLEIQLDNEKLLKSKNNALHLKIDELLIMSKEATLQAETKYAEGTKEIQSLLSRKESLEANATRLKATNDELAAKISELLSIAEEGTRA